MASVPLVTNGFVYTGDNYRIGKLIAVKGDQGLVRLRHSPVSYDEFLYPLKNLTRAILSSQMRVFWQDPKTKRWNVGRVRDHHRSGHIVYKVQFPNDLVVNIAEGDLETRSMMPYQEPTAALADGWCETQYYYDRRLPALTALVHARAGSQGMSGLTSAAIQLLPHQVEVVRRILSDPIQRYLLADEVGLGKTVETGCIIRQVLLDHPAEKVVILTPMALVRQWERELRGKFGIDEFPGRVSVRPFDALGEIKPDEVDMLVIDEAHHLVAASTTGQSILTNSQYWQLAQIAHSCRRLFVLSATPVLGDEDAMLRLLYLLDPSVHRLDDKEAFRRKLANRQDYGRLLMSLNPNARPFVLKRIGAQLLELFPDDDVVAQLAPTLINPDPDAHGSAVAYAVRQLRRHISETYRLHQRLLRTRRKDLQAGEMAPRRGEIYLQASVGSTGEGIGDALEDWRYASLVSVEGDRDEGGAFADRFRRLFEAAGQGPHDLATEAERQSRDVVEHHIPTFHGEIAMLQKMQRLAAAPSAESDWIASGGALVVRALSGVSRPLTAAMKAVAFTSSTSFAHHLADHLARTLGIGNVGLVLSTSTAIQVEEAVDRIRLGKQPAVLICDRSGEEGLNLHFVDAVVHLDQPLAPGRMEQRIGRVDRFGRRSDHIRHFMLLPTAVEGNPWSAWHRLLATGFQIYDNSVSDVQFCLESVEDELTRVLFRTGAGGLDTAGEDVQARLAQERIRLDEQYALDQLSLLEEESVQAFASLQQSDHEEHYEPLNRWLTETLRLGRLIVQGTKIFKVLWSEDTLMPTYPWKGLYDPVLNKPLSYRRADAVARSGIDLVRPGSRLVRTLERHLNWDDRGTSFATWRVDPDWNTAVNGEWVGFRLSYVVEVDMPRVTRLLNGKIDKSALPAIRRRADALFTPWVETVTLDINFDEVTDPTVCDILDRPYESHEKRGSDYNLGSLREALFKVVQPDVFYNLCQQVRERSAELIWQSPRLCQQLEEIAHRAESELQIRIAHLKRRRAAIMRLDGITDSAVEQEILMNRAILKVLPHPRVRLDAIGCFIISKHPPEGANS